MIRSRLVAFSTEMRDRGALFGFRSRATRVQANFQGSCAPSATWASRPRSCSSRQGSARAYREAEVTGGLPEPERAASIEPRRAREPAPLFNFTLMLSKRPGSRARTSRLSTELVLRSMFMVESAARRCWSAARSGSRRRATVAARQGEEVERVGADHVIQVLGLLLDRKAVWCDLGDRDDVG